MILLKKKTNNNLNKGELSLKTLNIAIDGHSSSGKSSVSSGISRKLGIKKLDTGALYRGIAVQWLYDGLGEITSSKITKFCKNLELKISFENEVQVVYVNGRNLTNNLRSPQVSKLASELAVYPVIRKFVKDLQVKFAENNACVIEGRDIGSEIIPNADYKFFVTADPEIRAERRFKQNLAKGIECDYEGILKGIKERDYLDENRKISPLKKSKEAILVDNSDLTLEETVDFCLNYIKNEKIN